MINDRKITLRLREKNCFFFEVLVMCWSASQLPSCSFVVESDVQIDVSENGVDEESDYEDTGDSKVDEQEI